MQRFGKDNDHAEADMDDDDIEFIVQMVRIIRKYFHLLFSELSVI